MKRVLIVDDELELGLLMAAMLKSAGCESTHAADAQEALSLLEKIQFDKVILDLHLGKSNGMDLIPSVTLLQKAADIVIVSAFADSHAVRDLHAKGIKKIIKKPFSKAELLEAVS